MQQQPCIKSELSLFDPPLVQVIADRALWADIHPTSAIDTANGPIEFHISGSQDEYLDLNDTILYVRLKVVKAIGSDLSVDTKIYPANLLLASLFSDVTLTLNGTVIEGGHHLYPYKAMMTCLLQFNTDVKNTQLRASGYKEDKTDREKWLVSSKPLELMGPLFLDLFSQSKYLLPGVDVRVKLVRSKLDFCLMNDGKETMKMIIEEATLYVRRVKVNPGVLLGHELGLKSSNAIYPIQQSEMLSFTIPRGSKSHVQDNLLRGLLPKLLIVGLVGNEAFNGKKDKDPTLFDHFDLNFLALYRDGECVPYGQPLQPDYANGLGVQAYMRTIQSLEQYNSNISHGITLDDFMNNGRTLYVMNLTPDMNASGACGQPYRTGNLRLEVKFSKALTETINVIIFAIRDGKIEITHDRQVLKQ
jgi:hypothetical protein